MNLAKLGDCRSATDRGKASFVPIFEVLARLMCEVAMDRLGDVLTLLNGHGSYSREPFPVFILQGGQVADHEHLGMARQRQIRLYHHASGTIAGHSQFLS